MTDTATSTRRAQSVIDGTLAGEWKIEQDPTTDPDDGPEPGTPDELPSSPVEAATISRRRRSGIAGLALGLLIVVSATWFSNAQGVVDIATQGTVGVRAETTLSAAAVARNGVAQASLIMRANLVGVATNEEVVDAVAAATTAIDELERRVGRLQVDLGAEPGVNARGFIDALDEALFAISTGDEDGAGVALVEVDQQFVAFEDELSGIRADALAEMAIARETAGQVAVGARLVVAFLIPLGAVLLYRFATVRATRRRELIRELDQERAMLQAKDDLIANISHELRTPLTGILGFAQTAALEPDLDIDDLRTMSSVIAGEADELARMVDDLITTARDDEEALALNIEPMDPIAELEAVLIPARVLGRTIGVDLERALLAADRLRFRQIIRNLVSNATKYGGSQVRLVGRSDEKNYSISVIDNGDGVDPEVEERLFTRFLHKGDTPLVTGSVGLGTSIARRLAEMMGGTLNYSRGGGETYFTLTLPLAKSRENPVPKGVR